MWTASNRGFYARSGLRYPSDLTEADWALVGPLIPPAKHGDNKRTVDEREVVNGIMYVLSKPVSRQIEASGVNGYRANAEALSARHLHGLWHAATVRNLMHRHAHNMDRCGRRGRMYPCRPVLSDGC